MIYNIIGTSTDLETYGVTLPKTVTDARETLIQARLVAAAAPLDDLQAAYAAGKVTASNVEKHLLTAAGRVAARTNMQQALAEVENGCSRTMRAGLLESAESILIALRSAFDPAAAVVQTAGRFFGSDPTPEQILAGGVEAVAANAELSAALNTLTRLRGLRVALADCGYGGLEAGEQDVTWWIAGAEDDSALAAAVRAYNAPGNAFHNLAAAGFTLRLNTPDEAARVAAGAKAATEAREIREREAELAEHRASWRPALDVMNAAE